jgi:pyridoxine kinase
MASILSINSQVAFGHVGAEAAAFALRRLGHDVSLIPTVQLSNHPGHGGYRGGPVPLSRAKNLLDGILERDLLNDCAAIHSGYLGAGEMAEVITHARENLPDALYCCDPVMGDGDQLYVGEDVADAIYQTLVPIADIVTPNAFELSLLTGMTIKNLEAALKASRALLSAGPEIVVCTSAAMEIDRIATIVVTASEAWVAWTPKIDKPPHGTGDAFAALFLGRYLMTGNVGHSLSLATASVQGLIAAGAGQVLKDIAIIQGQSEISDPSVDVIIETLD